jgi:hypothetical protein
VTEEPTETPPAGKQAVAVMKSGYSRWKGKYDTALQLGFGVLVKNPNSAWIAEQVDLSVAFIDSKGDVIDTADQTFAAILPGETVAWGDTLSDYEADWSDMKKMEVSLGEPTWEAASGSYGDYSFTNVSMRRDSLGDYAVTARLHSSFDKTLENPQGVAIFYRGSAIVGGGWTFIENAKDGVPLKIDTSFAGKTDRVEVYGNLSNLSLN